MVKSPRYYQLKNAIHVATKATRGKAKAALDILNEMRVREYSRKSAPGQIQKFERFPDRSHCSQCAPTRQYWAQPKLGNL